jgi:hypothetical protein
MNWILIKLLEFKVKKHTKHANNIRMDNSIIAAAYDNMIKNYKNTIMFLNAEDKQ